MYRKNKKSEYEIKYKSKRKSASRLMAAALAMIITAGVSFPAGVLANTAADSGTVSEVNTVAENASDVVTAEMPVVDGVNMEAADEQAEEILEDLNSNGGAVLFAEQDMSVPAAATDTVQLQYSRIIRHEDWFTRSFTVQYDGKTKVAYCIEPKDYPPDKQSHTSVKYDNEIMTKALYYSYGYPGYETVTKDYLAKCSLNSDYKGNDGAYVISHLILSYFYDNESDKSDAFKGLGTSTKNIIKNMAEAVKNDWPAVPDDASLSLDMTHVKAEWNKDRQLQETPVIKLNGHKDNKITVTVPEGATMVKLSNNELTEYTADMQTGTAEAAASGTGSGAETVNVDINGGDEFYFTAPADVTEPYESGHLIGCLQDFQPYLIKVTGKQDIMYCGDGGRDAVAFSIEWDDIGKFFLNKVSASPGITDNNDKYSLEGAEYEILDESGQIYEEMITDVNGNADVMLPYGSYILKEQTPPEGYAVDGAGHEIIIEHPETFFEHKEQIKPQSIPVDYSPKTGDELPDELLMALIIASIAVMTMLVALISPAAFVHGRG